jgi:hypothetical protein
MADMAANQAIKKVFSTGNLRKSFSRANLPRLSTRMGIWGAEGAIAGGLMSDDTSKGAMIGGGLGVLGGAAMHVSMRGHSTVAMARKFSMDMGPLARSVASETHPRSMKALNWMTKLPRKWF